MNLTVCNMTLQESMNGNGVFPSALRQRICHAIEKISTEEMDHLLTKHESDPENFDRTIEKNLQEIAPELNIKSNCMISNLRKFNCDLIIKTIDSYVCVEIEKNKLARFEFDILKMQAFASRLKQEGCKEKIYGAFIIPADNIVANHISGNSRESSYQYLERLSHLIAQINPLLLDDILLVGYSTLILSEISKHKKPQIKSKDSIPNYVILSEKGMLEEDVIRKILRNYPLELVFQLRNRLWSEYPQLREKINYNSHYLGYANGQETDALYVYFQKNRLLLDVRVSVKESERLKSLGFRVKPRNNYQCRAGWLTGLYVPYDTNNFEAIVDLAKLALKRLVT